MTAEQPDLFDSVNPPCVERCTETESPARVSFFDPAAAQHEMEQAALRLIRDREERLDQAGVRKDDPETYDRLRADVREAKAAYRAIRTFGPNT